MRNDIGQQCEQRAGIDAVSDRRWSLACHGKLKRGSGVACGVRSREALVDRHGTLQQRVVALLAIRWSGVSPDPPRLLR
jgi:hypothetical protein